MLKRWWRPAVAVNAALVLLVLAGGGWAYHVVWGGDTAAGTGGQQRSVTVTRGAVSATVSATGTVQSGTTAAANFVTAGTVTEISVKVGDAVTAGQQLAKVDPAAANGQLATARANLTAAQQSLARAQGNGSDAATVASISAQVTQANTAVETAQRAVAGTVLTAPIAGTVIAVNGAVGSSSSSTSSSTGTSGSGSSGGSSSSASGSSGSGFITLADLSKLQVSAAFAEADATRLKVGQAAAVTWSALSGARADAKITTIAPTATTSNNVNTYAVVSTLDSVPTGARIGQSATVRVTVAEVADVLRVPTAAVRSAGGQRTVQVKAANGGTETRTVQVGVEGDSFVEIRSGVTEGETLVIAPTTTSTSGTGNQQGGPGGGQFPGGGGQIPGGGGGR
ncbi:RND transporter [Virgisporangium aliadipatigenens]|uniref:RND transporter n=1 Tax=Virgisporangium aliadipatigenens TaxID=741659 RepID=A0A8J3YRK3_9ACTN|nr:efflux RND transporter periplasmic adaptor subunit [Virgisporangium aliadipatigenens]GIJ49098.1 RND transporter [Virgisporangium aliadipatigenens]